MSGTPPKQTATSDEVPPMSKVMMRSKPARRATNAAPFTPPDGPESTVWIGWSCAAPTDMRPPSDRTTCRPADTGTARSAPSSEDRYRRMTGPR